MTVVLHDGNVVQIQVRFQITLTAYSVFECASLTAYQVTSAGYKSTVGALSSSLVHESLEGLLL